MKLVWLIGLLLSVPAMAQKSDCIKVKPAIGESCEALKSSLTAEACPADQRVLADVRVECRGSSAKVRATWGTYRIEAKFKRQEAGWGDYSWMLQKSIRIREGSPSEKSDRQPAKDPSPMFQPEKPLEAQEADPFKCKLAGYADFRLSTLDNKGNASLDSGNSESGFGLEDGAVYFTAQKGSYLFVGDVPFRRFKNSDDNPNTGNQSNTSKIQVGADKMQLYGKLTLENGAAFSLGQFDTPYGVELNDSKDRFFGKTGLVYDATLPVTHAGVLIEIPVGGLSWKLLSANSNNKGTLGNSATGDNQFEYGMTLGGSWSAFRFQAGALMRPVLKSDGGSGGLRELYDFTLGVTFGALTVDTEFNSIQFKTTEKTL